MADSRVSWEDAETFLAVLEHGSFSSAAKALDLGQPTISRRIKQLEARVNSQLFVRGKQGAEPTVTALRLMPAAEQMAKWASEFARVVAGEEQEIAGVVRIAAPPGVAVDHLGDFSTILNSKHPEVALEVLSSISHLDLTRGGADLAIRTQFPNEPELMVLHSVEVQSVVAASKQYAGSIEQPCDWHDLDWVTWGGQFMEVPPRPMLEKRIKGFLPVFASDDYLVQKSAVKAGMGAMVMAVTEVTEGLTAIDVGISLPRSEIHIVCAKSMQHVPRVRAVAELLIEQIS